MAARPEIIDDEAVAAAWIAPEDGERGDQPYKDRVNHASKIGHPCDRYLELRRIAGDKATPPSPRLKAIFKRGRVLEQPVAVRQLIKAGFRVWDEQRTFDIIEQGETLLSCRIDCLVKMPPKEDTYVVDHKVINPHDWEKIPRGWAGYDFLRASTKPWLHSYPAQVQSYMYAHPGSAEVGLLQFINAETLLPKFVYVPFDPEFMQSILDRAIKVNATVKRVMDRGTVALSAPIDWTENICGRCEMLNVCLPDQLGRSPIELIEDDSFVELIERDREVSAKIGELQKEYKITHDRIKHMIGDKREVSAGHFWLTQKEINVKERIQKAYSYLRLDIKDLEPKEIQAEATEEVA